MRLLPSIDLRDGRCVRLPKGNFAQEIRYNFNPMVLQQRYADLGARWLHVVDLDGARKGVMANRQLIGSLAAHPTVRVQAGGGVRSSVALNDLLGLGVSRAVVGSAAIDEPVLVCGWLKEYGRDRICLAFDVQIDAGGVPRVQTRGWQRSTQIALWDAVQPFIDSGLRHVLCTDIDRDGALAGPNTALYAEAARRYPHLKWQASGGVSCAADLQSLAAAGATAAVSGRALLENRMNDEEIQPFLPAA